MCTLGLQVMNWTLWTSVLKTHVICLAIRFGTVHVYNNLFENVVSQ